MHELLRRQLDAHFGGEAGVPPRLAAFLESVEAAYQDLDRRRAFLRQVIDLNPHFMFAKDRQGRFTLVNEAVARAYGASVEELLGRTDADYNPNAAEVEAFRRDDLEVMETGRDKFVPEERITDAAGNTRWLETIKRAIPASAGGEPQVLGVATDITKRHEIETLLRERTETLRRHQDALLYLALLGDQDFNRALEEITRTASRVLGVDRVGVWTLADDGSRLVCRFVKQGDTFDPDPGAVVEAANHPRYFQAIRDSRTVATHDARTDPRTSEFTKGYLTPLGITSMLDVPIRYQGSVAGVLCHEHVGSPREWSPEEQHFAASLADFVSLALAAQERARLEHELRHAHKLEAIGHLAGGIAHDFNNLLTAMLGNCQLILDQMTEEDPHRPQVEQVRLAAQRAAQLTGQLLAFSRKQLLKPKVVDLNEILAGMEPLLRPLLGDAVILEFSLGRDLGQVRVDRGQIEQVILNLAVNARDAMPEGGRLGIRTSRVFLNAFQLLGHPGAQPGPFLRLEASDTGVGMEESTRIRIFEPFFSTKEPGKGTGLGLSTVYGIVRQSGGHIEVHSTPGHGTTFAIYLPLVDAAAEGDSPVGTPRPVPALLAGTETILLVEDEPHVRRLVRKVLELKGYRVIEAPDGPTALEKGGDLEQDLQLLLTDVLMPRLNGRELYERMRRDRPGLRVLYMSGNSEETFSAERPGDPAIAFIQKPFEPDDLVRRIREILDADAP